MIVIDTHIWIWWVNNDPLLRQEFKDALTAAQAAGIGVSIISCWEVAKLVENKKLILSVPVGEWINTALAYPGVRLLPLTPEIVVESTQLPGSFHKDPADQLITATARVLGYSLMTMDDKIRAYPHVMTVP